MASPTLDLICCAETIVNASNLSTSSNGRTEWSNDSQITTMKDNNDLQRLFNICAILSSCLSILGAIYILLPKKKYVPMQRKSFKAVERQKRILTWLSVADVFACIGVLVIGSFGIADLDTFQEHLNSSATFKWTCIISTAWIQYFYVATYFWTFFYALDVHLMLRGNNRNMFRVYFTIGWLLPAVMVIGGLIDLYLSSKNKLKCDPTFEAWRYLILHYLVSYVPMVIVLVINPFLYWISARKVGPLLMRGNMFTDREREIKRQVQCKFFLIVLVFTLCWLPNVINGCLLLHQLVSASKVWHTPNTFSKIIWVATAVLNPLQAFLNALIYWGPGGCTRRVPTHFDSDYANYNSSVSSCNTSDGRGIDLAQETTPLVQNLR